MILINSWKKGVLKNDFKMNQIPFKSVESLYWILTKNPNEKWPNIPHPIFGKQWLYLFYVIDTYKIYAIDDEDICFVNKYGYDLIGNPDFTDEFSTDHKYLFIHDDCFDKIWGNDQDSDNTFKVIQKETSLSSINVKRSNSILKKNSISENNCNTSSSAPEKTPENNSWLFP